MAMEPLPDRLGPRMAVLTDLQRKFCWLMAGGMENASGAARAAGYTDNGSLKDNGKSGIRVLAHRLMQDPRILDAIEECGRARLRMLAPMAINQVRAILEDRKHPYHGRMIETVLDRTGYAAKSEHTMRVEHSVDMRELEALARRLAAESGVGVERLLGTNEGKVIEGEVVDKVAQPVDSRETCDDGGPGDAADGGRDG